MPSVASRDASSGQIHCAGAYVAASADPTGRTFSSVSTASRRRGKVAVHIRQVLPPWRGTAIHALWMTAPARVVRSDAPPPGQRHAAPESAHRRHSRAGGWHPPAAQRFELRGGPSVDGGLAPGSRAARPGRGRIRPRASGPRSPLRARTGALDGPRVTAWCGSAGTPCRCENGALRATPAAGGQPWAETVCRRPRWWARQTAGARRRVAL